jgi:hypothetical protein
MSSDEILTSENVHLSRPRIRNEEHQKARAINCTFFPDIVAGYVSASLANNTQRAYLSDLAHFEAWGGTIPADPATISAYLAKQADTLSVSTLSRRIASISKAHQARSLPNPTRSELVRATLQGIRRLKGVAQRQAKPLLKEDLFLILDSLGESTKDVRDRALLLIGFAGGFRRCASGDGNQAAYLASIPAPMALSLIELIGDEWGRIRLDTLSAEQDAGYATEVLEEEAAEAIRNRTDIGDTEKVQLVKSRRGQGVYRQNLEQFEKRCRVTGAESRQHLRASHIKPWRVCDTFEKLDGNNRLLLSPHIDHLFDQGYISFSNEGELLVSPAADKAALYAWSVKPGTLCGRFRAEQITYLDYHREFVFRAAAFGT